MLNWSEKYSVQNEIIDVQHRKLFAIVNAFSQKIAVGEGSEGLNQVLDEMSTYAWLHFRTEEDLLFKADYDALKEHKIQHEAFKRELMNMAYKNIHEKSDALIKQVHRYLETWLTSHILEEDVKYVKRIK